jgi:flagellar FliL protein
MANDEAGETGGGKRGLLIGLVAALVLGAGGFYAAYSGLVGGPTEDGEVPAAAHPAPDTTLPDIAFIPLDPLVVSLGRGATNRHLRFSAQLEVPAAFEAEVRLLTPRVLDVLNGFLRAVDSRDIETPASLGRLRAQMLRRAKVVVGEDRVRDLLITEFVLN